MGNSILGIDIEYMSPHMHELEDKELTGITLREKINKILLMFESEQRIHGFNSKIFMENIY
jgi:hypothetical protein